MPYLCPMCNALQFTSFQCPECGQAMTDAGRLMDFFDDYSAYLDIEGMKSIDGFPDDRKLHQCPHVLYCSSCQKQFQHLVEEIFNP